MDAIEAQRELVKFLLKRLKACALESISLHGVLMNFSDELQTQARAMQEVYRQSRPIQRKVESQFRDLDSLIQQVDAGIQEEEFRKLLEQYDPDGKPN